jgi:hypothetical protein
MTPTDDEIMSVLLTWRQRTQLCLADSGVGSAGSGYFAADDAAFKALRGLFGRGNGTARTERLEVAAQSLAGWRASGENSTRSIEWALEDADELIAALDAKGTDDET